MRDGPRSSRHACEFDAQVDDFWRFFSRAGGVQFSDSETEKSLIKQRGSLIKSCATQESAMDISPADAGCQAAPPRGSGTAPAPQPLAGAERRLGLFVDGAEYEHLELLSRSALIAAVPGTRNLHLTCKVAQQENLPGDEWLETPSSQCRPGTRKLHYCTVIGCGCDQCGSQPPSAGCAAEMVHIHQC